MVKKEDDTRISITNQPDPEPSLEPTTEEADQPEKTDQPRVVDQPKLVEDHLSSVVDRASTTNKVVEAGLGYTRGEPTALGDGSAATYDVARDIPIGGVSEGDVVVDIGIPDVGNTAVGISDKSQRAQPC